MATPNSSQGSINISAPQSTSSGTVQPGASVLNYNATSSGYVSIKNPDGSQLLVSPQEFAKLSGQTYTNATTMPSSSSQPSYYFPPAPTSTSSNNSSSASTSSYPSTTTSSQVYPSSTPSFTSGSINISAPQSTSSGTVQPGASVLNYNATSSGYVSIKNPDGSQLLVSPQEFAKLSGQTYTPQATSNSSQPSIDINKLAQQIAESAKANGIPLIPAFVQQFPQFASSSTSSSSKSSSSLPTTFDINALNGANLGNIAGGTTVTSPTSTSSSELASYDAVIKKLQEQQAQATNDLTKLFSSDSATNTYNNFAQSTGLISNQNQLKDVQLQIADLEGRLNYNKEAINQQPIQSAFISGQQAQQDRLANINLLNLRAKEAVLQNSVGLAQNLVDRAVDLQYKDVQNKIEIQKMVLAQISDNLTSAEKAKADYQKSLLDAQSKYIDLVAQQQKENNKNNLDLVRTVAENGGNVNAIDLNAPYSQNITNPSVVSNLNKKTISSLPSSSTSGGVSQAAQNIVDIMRSNGDTNVNNYVKGTGVAAQNLRNEVFAELKNTNVSQFNPQAGQALQLVNEILPNVSEISGIVRTGMLTGTRSKLDQLLSLITLNARSLIKGQGQVSDYETKILTNSTNALNGGYFSGLLSEDFATNELKKIRGVINLNAGVPVYVGITDPVTGTTKYDYADRNTIFDAASQGYIINYE